MKWLATLFGKQPDARDENSIPAHESDLPPWVWGIAANVRTRESKDDGRSGGTKHFAPGSRVYLCKYNWHWDGAWPVVGKKKGTHRYIRKVMSEDDLENFRVVRIYSPTVISWMVGARSRKIVNHGDSSMYGNLFRGWGNTDADRREVAAVVEAFHAYYEEEWGVTLQ